MPISSMCIHQLIDEAEGNTVIVKSKLGEHRLYKIVNNDNVNTAFLCSVLQIDNSTIFIKLVSTIDGIDELEEDFKSFCSSFKSVN